jgi:protein-disulfide isomerase
MTTLPRRAVRDVRVLVGSPLAMTVAVLFFAGAASTLAFFPREGGVMAAGDGSQTTTSSQEDRRSELERFMATAPRVPIIVPAEGAKVLIVKFNDYQCPACGQSYLQYKPILAKYQASHPGAVRLVLKDYPLNNECNANLVQTLHPAACDAAVAVRLARRRNREEAMEEWLYTHQLTMTRPSVRQAARDIGGITDFDAQYESAMTSVKLDVGLGRQLGINSTPTFFINGVKVDGMWAPKFFDQAIAYELEHAAAK